MQKNLQALQGQNLEEVKIRIKTLIFNNPVITSYSTRFILPNSLMVNVLEKKPVYAIRPIADNIYFDIDKEGVAVKIQKENNLPLVTTSLKLPNVGEKIDNKMLFGLEIVNSIYYSYQVVDAAVENDSLTVLLPGGITVIFPLEGNRDALLGAFKLIFERLKADNSGANNDLGKITNIDLRFKNPVLK
jgi:hypothetical protein